MPTWREPDEVLRRAEETRQAANKPEAAKTYRCTICGAVANGMLCERCRADVDRGDFARIDTFLPKTS